MALEWACCLISMSLWFYIYKLGVGMGWKSVFAYILKPCGRKMIQTWKASYSPRKNVLKSQHKARGEQLPLSRDLNILFLLSQKKALNIQPPVSWPGCWEQLHTRETKAFCFLTSCMCRQVCWSSAKQRVTRLGAVWLDSLVSLF